MVSLRPGPPVTQHLTTVASGHTISVRRVFFQKISVQLCPHFRWNVWDCGLQSDNIHKTGASNQTTSVRLWPPVRWHLLPTVASGQTRYIRLGLPVRKHLLTVASVQTTSVRMESPVRQYLLSAAASQINSVRLGPLVRWHLSTGAYGHMS